MLYIVCMCTIASVWEFGVEKLEIIHKQMVEIERKRGGGQSGRETEGEKNNYPKIYNKTPIIFIFDRGQVMFQLQLHTNILTICRFLFGFIFVAPTTVLFFLLLLRVNSENLFAKWWTRLYKFTKYLLMLSLPILPHHFSVSLVILLTHFVVVVFCHINSLVHYFLIFVFPS